MSLPEVIELQGSLDLDTSARVHHLPCRVSHDGAAKVNTYFVPADVAAFVIAQYVYLIALESTEGGKAPKAATA